MRRLIDLSPIEANPARPRMRQVYLRLGMLRTFNGFHLGSCAHDRLTFPVIFVNKPCIFFVRW